MDLECCPWPPPPPLIGFPWPPEDSTPSSLFPPFVPRPETEGDWPTPKDLPLPSMFPLPPPLLPLPPFFPPVPLFRYSTDYPPSAPGVPLPPPKDTERLSSERSSVPVVAPHRGNPLGDLKKPSQPPPFLKNRKGRDAASLVHTGERREERSKGRRSKSSEFESVYQHIRKSYEPGSSRQKEREEKPAVPTTALSTSSLKDDLLRLETQWRRLEDVKNKTISTRKPRHHQTLSAAQNFTVNRDNIMALINERKVYTALKRLPFTK